jgi:hypothetical protein
MTGVFAVLENSRSPNQAMQERKRASVRVLQETIGTNGEEPWHLDRLNQRALPLDGVLSSHFNRSDASLAAVDVYVVDSGLVPHADFGDRVLFDLGANFVHEDGQGIRDVTDTAGHGTHVTGLIIGEKTGLAPRANVIPLRVFGKDATGPVMAVVRALQYAAQLITARGRPSIVNLSFATPRDVFIDAAVGALLQLNAIVVSAAGNGDGADACNFSPAGLSPVIAVGATTRDDAVAPFSNVGDCVDVFAPGQRIISTSNKGTYTSYSGTSMAAPLVSGAAALYLERFPGSNQEDFLEALSCALTRQVVTGNVDTQAMDGLLYVPPEGFTKAGAPGCDILRMLIRRAPIEPSRRNECTRQGRCYGHGTCLVVDDRNVDGTMCVCDCGYSGKDCSVPTPDATINILNGTGATWRMSGNAPVVRVNIQDDICDSLAISACSLDQTTSGHISAYPEATCFNGDIRNLLGQPALVSFFNETSCSSFVLRGQPRKTYYAEITADKNIKEEAHTFIVHAKCERSRPGLATDTWSSTLAAQANVAEKRAGERFLFTFAVALLGICVSLLTPV